MSEDSTQAKLLEQFQRIVAEHEQARVHQGEGQPDYSHSVELLNLASAGFGVASRLVPLLIANDTRDPRTLVQKLTRWQRFVVGSAADAARVTAYESIADDDLVYRVGDTFYMGGDPNADDKSEATASLIGIGVLAELPRRDVYGVRQRDWCYRLTDLGAQVAEQLAEIMIAEDDAREASEAQEGDAHAH